MPAPRTLPDGLRLRLESSRQPLVEDDLVKASARAEAIRTAHIDVVKERAARDLQRASEAAARKLRIAAAAASKAAERAKSVESRASERKATLQEKRLAQATRRAALAAAVHEARREADLDSLRKGVENATRGEQAVEARQKLIEALRLRSSRNVHHALEVVRARKEKDVELATELAAKLEGKLSAAEERRHEIAHAADRIDEVARARNVKRARNEQAFSLQVKKAAIGASLERAAANRARTLSIVQEAAAFFNAHVAEVASTVKATSIDGVEEYKASMYKKLNAADVTRSLALKARATKNLASPSKPSAAGAAAGELSHRSLPRPACHPEVIHVDVANAQRSLKSPPEALLRRLSFRPQKLLATSCARQIGAFTRRELIGTTWHQKAVVRIGKVTRAAGKRAAARALFLSKLQARESRAIMHSVLKDRQHAKLKARNAALTTLVDANVLAMEEERALQGVAAAVRCEHASEQRSKIQRSVAKRGVPAVRAAAATSRRASHQVARNTRGHFYALRSLTAAASRAEALEKVVTTAARLEGAPRSVHWSHAIVVEPRF